MIRSITLDNFQSFDHIELDLSDKGDSIKNSAFVYGENGSGKSNLINSVFFLLVSSGNLTDVTMRGMESGESFKDDDLTGLVPCLRMIGSEGNMRLSYDLSMEGINTVYTMEYNENGILVSERLDSTINSKMSNMFSLERGKEPIFRRDLLKGKPFVDKIQSEVFQFWGRRSFISIINEIRSKSNEDFVEASIHPRLLEFLRGLEDIIIEPTSFSAAHRSEISLLSGTIPMERKKELDIIESRISMFFSRLYTDITGAYYERKVGESRIGYELFFRKRIAGAIREVPVKMESSGTLKLLHMLRPLLLCVGGRTVLIDEMDTGIHDLLITGMMAQMIPEIDGQLIATTHNTCLMNILSPKNVFIIGVDMNGYKRIRCVSSIERIRKSNSIRHKYYEGDLMGIPYVANLGISDILEAGRED